MVIKKDILEKEKLNVTHSGCKAERLKTIWRTSVPVRGLSVANESIFHMIY